MDRMLKFFAYDHLRDDLKLVSQAFAHLAHHIAQIVPQGPERTVSLRKLLEAKDAAVRAVLGFQQLAQADRALRARGHALRDVMGEMGEGLRDRF